MNNANPQGIKVGSIINAKFEIVRPFNDGEAWYGQPISNLRGALWIARPYGFPEGQEILICSDVLEPKDVVKL